MLFIPEIRNITLRSKINYAIIVFKCEKNVGIDIIQLVTIKFSLVLKSLKVVNYVCLETV